MNCWLFQSKWYTEFWDCCFRTFVTVSPSMTEDYNYHLSYDIKKKRKKKEHKETATLEMCLCFVMQNLFHAALPYLRQTVRSSRIPKLLSSGQTPFLDITGLLADPVYFHCTWSWLWFGFLWAQICLLSTDLPSTGCSCHHHTCSAHPQFGGTAAFVTEGFTECEFTLTKYDWCFSVNTINRFHY